MSRLLHRLTLILGFLILAGCTASDQTGTSGPAIAETPEATVPPEPTRATSTTPVANPTPSPIATPSPAPATAAGQTLVSETLGDGSTMTRVPAHDGSTFALRLPQSFGTQLTLSEPAADPTRLASLLSENAAIHINVGYCPYEPLTVNAHGLLAGRQVLNGRGQLLFCRPDELLHMVIEPAQGVVFNIDDVHLVAVGYGREYIDQIVTLFGPPTEQCCFEDRGPMWLNGSFVMSNGNLDGQITSYDGDTLIPQWSTDLRSAIESDQAWVGDGSYLQMLTDSGTLLAHTGYGFVVALSAETGDVLWQADLAGESPGRVLPGDYPTSTLFVTSDVRSEGDLSAPTVRLLDMDTGAELWIARGEPGTDLHWSRPVVMGDVLLVADVPSYQPDTTEHGTSSVLAFRLSTGERAWIASLENSNLGFTNTQTIVTDSGRDLLLALSDGGMLFRLDPQSGEKLWRAAVGATKIVGLSPDTVTVIRGLAELEISLDDGTVVS